MSFRVSLLKLPEYRIHSFTGEKKRVYHAPSPSLIPVDIISKSDQICTINPSQYGFTLTCGRQVTCSAERIRREGKNILQVHNGPLDPVLVKSIFQVARDVGCDYVSMYIPDVRLCL